MRRKLYQIRTFDGEVKKGERVYRRERREGFHCKGEVRRVREEVNRRGEVKGEVRRVREEVNRRGEVKGEVRKENKEGIEGRCDKVTKGGRESKEGREGVQSEGGGRRKGE